MFFRLRIMKTLPVALVVVTLFAIFGSFKHQVSAFNHDLDFENSFAIELETLGCGNGNNLEGVLSVKGSSSIRIGGIDDNASKGGVSIRECHSDNERQVVVLVEQGSSNSDFTSINLDDNSTSIQNTGDFESEMPDSCPICLDDLKPVDLSICEALSNMCFREFKLGPVIKGIWILYTKYNGTDEEEPVYFHLPHSYNASNGAAPYEVMAKHRAHRKCVGPLITSASSSLVVKCPFCNVNCRDTELTFQAIVAPKTLRYLLKFGLYQFRNRHPITYAVVFLSWMIFVALAFPLILVKILASVHHQDFL